MVIYALVLRKFIFCPGLLPFTAGHRSVQGSRVGILKFQVGPGHIDRRLTVCSEDITHCRDNADIFCS